ncbi:MAG TPA: prenyltransferase/squalene oxidase repeat-containing protein, partial [Pirellulales bacterium]|nr:prenyltransferase/squalene oxidase repeat-containing protein [Pirellulales bacterium]
TESLTMAEAPHAATIEENNSDDKEFEHKGGGVVNGSANSLGGAGGFDVKAMGPGPAVKGFGGFGSGVGTGANGGSGGDGSGIGGRGKGKQAAMAASGGTRQSERAVAAALFWLSRHQSNDGSWSLKDFDKKCTDKTCTGHGEADSDTGATALGLLPFLAAGQTQVSPGPYKSNIHAALYYLMSVQKKDGDLKGDSKGNAHMYAHGLCAIALCEAYALSQDKAVGRAAQQAINFIVSAQNAGTGGWRYEPGQEGDTSVVGWQVMALKSAQMAYLNVPQSALDGAKKWLDSCSSGNYKEMCSYQPDSGPTMSMTSVGLLCNQYLHMKRDDPKMHGGVEYLMKNLPSNGQRNIYYWYYATQVMHNLPGTEWDTWNRTMRKLLIDTQEKEGCAAGSWNPDKPGKDAWGGPGGRVMITSLSALTLEVYYRYLPLYQLDGKNEILPRK